MKAGRIEIHPEASVDGIREPELAARAREIAAALASEKGNRVAILVPPGPDFVTAFFGVLSAGATVVVLSPLHPPAETKYFCEDAGVRTILVDDAYADHAAHLQGVRRLQDLHGDTPPAFEISESSPALQLYTSGTTGKPKGAVLTHLNIGTQQRLVGEAWGFSPADTLLHALPLHHMHGLCIALMTALGAGANVTMTTFDAKRIWDQMQNATVFMAVPSMYHRLFIAFDAADPETQKRWTANAAQLRLATSGSAALPVTLAERWRALTGKIPLERFGMTEIGVGITNVLDGERFPGCVGFPLPTVETRIEDGELWIRGPSVFAGYHERPEETAKAFADGGWFKTGDTVERVGDANGPFKILGRTSVDILKSGGYKLSALEIEETLRAHPSVSEAAVIGVPDEAWGDRVVACIIPRDGHAPIEADLRAFVREHLAPYKVPKEIRIVTELPKNALGKVVKPELLRQVTASEVDRD